MIGRRAVLGGMAAMTTWGDPGRPAQVPGGNPEMRPDQLAAHRALSSAGSGPAPQNAFILAQRVIVFGTGPARGLFVYNGTPGAGTLVYSITESASDPFGNPTLAGATSYSASGVINENGGVLLCYAPTAAAGNLVFSVSPFTTTDSFGNSVFSGHVIYSLSGGVYTAIRWYGAGMSISTAASEAGPWTGQSQSLVVGAAPTSLTLTGDTAFLGTRVVAGAISFVTAAALEVHSLLALATQAAPGTPPAGFGFGYVNSTDSALHYKDVNGIDSQLTPMESPQSMSALGFANSWTNSGAPNVAAFYRHYGGDMVEIGGSLTVPVAGPNTTIVTLPAAYRPSHTQRIKGIVAGQSGFAAQATDIFVAIDSAGNLIAHNIAAGGTSMTLEINGVYSLSA